MPTYTSPEAGEIEAPDPYTACRWLMHRYTHELYGERAIVRMFDAAPLDDAGDIWNAAAYLGAPTAGGPGLEYTGIMVYDLDALLRAASYPEPSLPLFPELAVLPPEGPTPYL